MNDSLISRQAAIDLAKDLMIPGTDYLQHNQAIMNYEAELVRLPSAQPEPCEDAVSREAAIDAALSAFSRGLLASPDIRKLPSVQPEPQWIPVSERLPEDGEECLVSIRYPNEFVLIDRATYSTDLFTVDKEDFFGNRGESGWYYYDREYGYCNVLNVIAWMPLPEPYRAERRTDERFDR